jgi:uncharacterized protein YbjT (DUF2867 family)
MNVFVLGGGGFIGRHVVAALRDRRHDVVVGSRKPKRHHRHEARDVRIRQVRFEKLVSADSWLPLLADVDVVVNCVGILRERVGETYDAVHHRSPAALGEACAAAGIRNLVHVSALGLGPQSVHGFLTSKWAGEHALRRCDVPTTIVRPSLLDGEGGFGARWLRRLARLPIHMVPGEATGRIAVLDVGDLGAAIARLCEEPAATGCREVELGGVDPTTLAEHLLALRRVRTRSPALTIRVPAWLARSGARLCDLLHFSPYSLGHLELLSRDNVPADNLLPVLLGRSPIAIGIAVPVSALRLTRDGRGRRFA